MPPEQHCAQYKTFLRKSRIMTIGKAASQALFLTEKLTLIKEIYDYEKGGKNETGHPT